LGAPRLVSFAVLMWLTLRAFGQEPQIWPKTVSVDAANSLTAPLQYRLPDKKPQNKTELEIKGTGQNWSFVSFEQLPDNTEIRTKGQLDGYNDSEEIRSEKWYWFKNKLPLILEIKSGAQTPVKISFWFGSPSPDGENLRANTINSDGMREFTENHQFVKDPRVQTVVLTWDGPGGTNPISINPSTVSFEVPEDGRSSLQRITLSGDSKLWTLVRLKEVSRRIELIARTSDAESLTVESGATLRVDDWIGFKNSLGIDVSLFANQPETDREVIVLETAIAQSSEQTKEAVTQEIKADRIVSTGNIPITFTWKLAQGDSTGKFLTILKWTVVIVLVIGLGVFLWWFLSGLQQARRTMKPKMRVQQRNKSIDDFESLQPKPAPIDLTSKIDDLVASSGTTRKNQASVERVDSGDRPASSFPGDYVIPLRKKKPNREERRDLSPLESISSPPSKSDLPTSTKAENTAAKNEPLTGSPATSFSRHEFEQLRQMVIALSKAIDDLHATSVTNKRFDEELNQLLEMQMRVREQLNQLKQKGEVEAKKATLLLETEIRGFRRDLLKSLHEQQSEFRNEVQERNEWSEKTTTVNINSLRLEINEVRDKLNQLFESKGEQEIPDSFYARTLGEILAQNIETLRDGNLEQLSQQLGGRLNQFFKTEIPHGAQLVELRQHCEAVNSALHDVVGQMAELNPKAAEGAAPHLQRSATLAAELASLQGQLQSRRLVIETTLRIPVSAYPGARQTFTDELGRGIKLEIDKLSEPRTYFAAELKRLTTTDVIAVVDICDKEISHPGVHPELEAALVRLFKHAGLRQIVPRQGEPVTGVEHDVLPIVPNGSSRGSGIAQVVTRGFYNDYEGDKTLLRKAGVAVYR
jgi:hypothetical protein